VPQSYRKYGELETRQVFSVLDQLKDVGCFYLGFTGGEPFARKDIMKILWYAKRCGFEIIIYTNGSLINKETARELGRLRPNKVDITIPGMTKEAFEKVTGVISSRDKVFDAIGFLHKNGIELGFKTCLLKENEDEIEEIEVFSASLEALHRLDTMLMPRLDGSEEPYKYRGRRSGARGQEGLLQDRECQVLNSISNKTGDAVNLFECGVGQSQAAITPLGELKMCVMINYPKYNILESSLENAWKQLKELVKDMTPCESQSLCKAKPQRSEAQYAKKTKIQTRDNPGKTQS